MAKSDYIPAYQQLGFDSFEAQQAAAGGFPAPYVGPENEPVRPYKDAQEAYDAENAGVTRDPAEATGPEQLRPEDGGPSGIVNTSDTPETVVAKAEARTDESPSS
jgi:hypothetical protein